MVGNEEEKIAKDATYPPKPTDTSRRCHSRHISAKAGIDRESICQPTDWIPAFAGMTEKNRHETV
jgi:hypothetical protein